EHVRTTQDWDPGLATWVNRYRSIETTPRPAKRQWTYEDWDPLANGGQGDWISDWQHVVTVDANGDVVERLNLTWDPAAAGGQGGWVYTGRGVITRNNQGLVVEDKVQGWRGSFYNQFRILYTYEDFIGTATEHAPKPKLTLEANYPNPFRDQTAIRFDVPQSQHVTIEVFDMLGRKVATLVDGSLGPGSHVAILTAEMLAGGLYVYRLQANNVRISRTMMLVR
ncbi:MAG: T9SS type A sorting domain-containing protein, partial [Rhodothermales bacterium]|nr:T9SS type A sorting domain-containing protein [Rhodothermales bacterium]